MSRDGVLTWAIPAIPSSGPIDEQWYNAYKFLVKVTDDGAGGVPRSKTAAIFQSPELDVNLSGTAGTSLVGIKDTPIAVDTFLVTPVETLLQANVKGENYDLNFRGGDYVFGGATFQLVGGGPSHADSFSFYSSTVQGRVAARN